MEMEVSSDQLNEVKNVCSESLKKGLDENYFSMEGKNKAGVVSTSKGDGACGGEILVPATPELNRESGDCPLNIVSPWTLVTSLKKPHCLYSQQSDDMCSPDDDSPHTPKTGVFDPFAPGPDKLMLAPYCKKVQEQSQGYVARRLEFGSFLTAIQDENHEGDSESISEEEIFMETMYNTLLELVFTKQLEGFCGEGSSQDDGSDGIKTPTSAPHFNGLAGTCPGAPTKATRKLRNIDPELCRKLEF